MPMEAEMPIRDNTGKRARSDAEKANVFAAHLQKVFQPNPPSIGFTLPHVSDPLIHDLISPKIIMELPNCAVRCISTFFNAIAKNNYLPIQWKKSPIIMILVPGKDRTQPSFYRPMSLLSCISKIFEKLLIIRIQAHLQTRNTVPLYQFGLRQNHGTSISTEIITSFEHKEYCTAVFKQSTECGWEGLMYKIKTLLSPNTHKLLESYLFKKKSLL